MGEEIWGAKNRKKMEKHTKVRQINSPLIPDHSKLTYIFTTHLDQKLYPDVFIYPCIYRVMNEQLCEYG